MAEQQWQPRVQRLEDDERGRLQYVRSLIREQRFDEAQEELLAILQENERSVPARMMLGSLYQRQEAYGEALDQYKYAIAIDPMHVQANLRAGNCCLRMNDIEQAKAFLMTTLQLDPQQVNAHVALAQALSRSGDIEGAIHYLEGALRFDPQMASARMLMAQLLNRSGNTGEAIEELSGFVNANPEHPNAVVGLARLHMKQGETAKAIELLESATKKNGSSREMWTMLGRLKANTKDYEGAERAFSELLRLQPQNRFGSIRLVSTLVPQHKFDEARQLLKKLPRRGRLAALVHQYYGDIYAAQNMYAEAVQSYRAALLHSPEGTKQLEEIEGSDTRDSRALVAKLQAAIAARREDVQKRVRDGRSQGSPARSRQLKRRRAQAAMQPAR